MPANGGSNNKNNRQRHGRDIVAIGGSAGALDAMIELVAGLPPDYRGALFFVSHIGANPSQLPELLTRAGPFEALHARHEEPICPGRIYVAPPDRHMVIAGGRVLLSALPREHFTRPAIDPLFRTAALAYGARVVGIVLSGTGSDGAVGLEAIKRAGGVAAVQDPADALFPEMPQTALRTLNVDHVVTAGELGALLVHLLDAALPVSATAAQPASHEMDMDTPIALTCPECGGAVREIPGTGVLAYRCHTGHRFSADELLVHQLDDVERAIMVAIRVLSERTALCRRMIGEAKAAGRSHGVAYWTRLKAEADEQLTVLQTFLTHTAEPGEPPEHEAAAATLGDH
ncbi:MAG: chemotaxis protein CheB [Alphaproteobacteria bacterium]|nr:chemotaxis protein CheB [Alphaproteobacteria bacterium]